MSDPGELRKTREKGDKAKRLLDNPLLISAFNEIHAQLHAGLDSLQTDDIDKFAPEITRQLRALRAVKEKLHSYVKLGKIATKELEDIGQRRRTNHPG